MGQLTYTTQQVQTILDNSLNINSGFTITDTIELNNKANYLNSYSSFTGTEIPDANWVLDQIDNNFEFSDDDFKIYDATDNTKQLEFELSGLTTSNVTKLKVTDNDGTIMTYNDNDTFITPNGKLYVDGDIAVSGTVDGRDVSVDGIKLDSIEDGAQVNVNADWDSTTGDSEILNKPTDVTDLSTHASSELSDGADLVKGPVSAIDNTLPRFDLTTGKLLQAGGSITNLDNGNVGIGTTEPKSTLDVQVANDRSLNISGAVSSQVILAPRQGSISNNLRDIKIAATSIAFDTTISSTSETGTERMRIAGAGQVGIGTNNPTEKLHVIGNIRSSAEVHAGTKVVIASKVEQVYDSVNQSLKFNFI